jgi:EAL domain-containing protein (putative c-di-GMP-specific phosphodiesterase class I)
MNLPNTMPSARNSKGPREARRLLVVDDDEKILKMLERTLGSFGYDVLTSGPREAVQHIVAEKFCAILLDISMPEISGLELLSVVRAQDARVPVLMLTGETTASAAISALNLGADAYLSKPSTPQLIAERIEAVIAKRAVRVGSAPILDFEPTIAKLWMAYQPIVASSTLRIVAHEALLRSDDLLCSTAIGILDAADRAGRGLELGWKARSRIARDIQEHSYKGDIFVNVGASEILDPKFIKRTEALLPISDRVVFEITERSHLDDAPEAAAALRTMRQHGFRIAVDDLGAGYAGLASLISMEPEYVKLDMALARGINMSLTRQRVVESVVDLCKSLSIRVIAEGIETEGEAQFMMLLGVDYLQGYWFGHPAREFTVK